MEFITLKKAKKEDSRGFTIIELLIATVIFSVILVVILAAFVQISRLFYKGVNMSNTQDDTRTALNDIASDIQFASGNTLTTPISSSPNSSGSFCVGSHRYAYYTGVQVQPGSPGLAGIYRETVTGCPPLTGIGGVPVMTSGPNAADQLLGPGMQLNSLGAKCSGLICILTAHVVFYGGDPNGLFTSRLNFPSINSWQQPDAECTGALSSSQYCSTANYSSTVLQKV